MKKKKISTILRKDLQKNWSLYVLIIPVIIFYILFMYKPMYGALIAFQNYKPAKGFGADWVGLKHFIRFFNNPYFFRLLRNTLAISILQLVIGFPIPIILALLINEMKNKKFKSISQSVMYLPHFISLVVICGMVIQFTLSDGLFNDIIAFFGGEREALLQQPNLYWAIYVLTTIWRNFGWDSIIFVAALSGVNKDLYEAASIDGAGKWKQTLHVTLPSIAPTIVIMLILSIGNLMNLGYEQTILLYNPSVYETADVIGSYVYRSGLLNQEWSYSTAVGLFNSVINVSLVFIANKISKKVSDIGIF